MEEGNTFSQISSSGRIIRRSIWLNDFNDDSQEIDDTSSQNESENEEEAGIFIYLFIYLLS